MKEGREAQLDEVARVVAEEEGMTVSGYGIWMTRLRMRRPNCCAVEPRCARRGSGSVGNAAIDSGWRTAACGIEHRLVREYLAAVYGSEGRRYGRGKFRRLASQRRSMRVRRLG